MLLVLIKINIMKKQILTTILAFLSLANYAQTSNKYVNISKDNLALQGHDAVAYFESNKAMKGSKDIRATHNNTVYYFLSEANRIKFLKNPVQYEPQFGGFCAYGMSEGYKAPINPDAFTIVDGKLYLNYDLSVKKEWSKSKAEHIKKANENWEKLTSEK